MKTILAAILALGFQAQAKTVIADEIKTVITCERAVNIPDLGLSVKVLEGGIAGMTQVEVSTYYIGHSTLKKYYVQQQPAVANRMGSPIVYNGNGVVLSINFTIAPDAQGGHLGYLEITSADGEITTDELRCQTVSTESTNQLFN